MALFTSAPSAITLAAGQTSTLTVGGGGSGSQFVSYKASSNNPLVVTASIGGTNPTLAGLAGGTAIVNVTDTGGANVVINVTVPTAPGQTLAVAAPSAVTLAPSSTTQYKITGGTGPYTAVSSNPNVAAVAAGSDSLSVTAANSGSATIVIFDSKGASAQLSLNVSGAGRGGAGRILRSRSTPRHRKQSTWVPTQPPATRSPEASAHIPLPAATPMSSRPLSMARRSLCRLVASQARCATHGTPYDIACPTRACRRRRSLANSSHIVLLTGESMKLKHRVIASVAALLTAHVSFAADTQDANEAQIIRNVAPLLKDLPIEKVTPSGHAALYEVFTVLVSTI